MGILDNLMFWKKDKFDLDSLGKDLSALPDPNTGLEPNLGLNQNMGMPNSASDPLAQPQQFQSFQTPQSAGLAPDPSRPQSFNSLNREQQQQRLAPQAQTHMAKDLEIISSKLDALKSALESVSQRLANLERMAQDQQHDDRVKQAYRNMPQRPY